MLLYILITLAVLVIGLLAYASNKPNTVRYERSITINTSPEKILPHLNDFRKWAMWSPYDRMDPKMKRSFSNATEGVGAQYVWESTGKAGAGSMELLTSNTGGVKIDLRFTKPFKNNCITHFNFVPQGQATSVSWVMDGAAPFISKVMGTLMNLDKKIGNDFEIGLASLKRIAENK